MKIAVRTLIVAFLFQASIDSGLAAEVLSNEGLALGFQIHVRNCESGDATLVVYLVNRGRKALKIVGSPVRSEMDFPRAGYIYGEGATGNLFRFEGFSKPTESEIGLLSLSPGQYRIIDRAILQKSSTSLPSFVSYDIDDEMREFYPVWTGALTLSLDAEENTGKP